MNNSGTMNICPLPFEQAQCSQLEVLPLLPLPFHFQTSCVHPKNNKYERGLQVISRWPTPAGIVYPCDDTIRGMSTMTQRAFHKAPVHFQTLPSPPSCQSLSTAATTDFGGNSSKAGVSPKSGCCTCCSQEL